MCWRSVVAAGLNPRVTGLVVHVPAGADVTPALRGRAPSYPNWNVRRPEVLTTARYFDAAHFAPRTAARALVTIGDIDESSTPWSIWSVVNGVRGPTEVVPLLDTPYNHLASPRQLDPWDRRSAAWLAAFAREEVPRVAPR